jgi:hypothetical protein
MAISQSSLGGYGNLFGNSPHEPHQFTGNGHNHLVGMFASSDQAAAAFAQPNLRLPADLLEGVGLGFEPQLQMSTPLGRIAIGPGTFNERTTGRAMARFGDGALAAPLTGGILRGNQAQELHELSGISEAGEVAEFGDRGDRRRELDAAECLKGLDHRLQAPRCDLLVALLVETLEAFGVLGDRADIFLEDELLRGGGQTTSASRRRWAGFPVARPVERISCRSKQALSRNLAALRALRVSSRARVRSRMASSSTWGT